MRNIYWSKPLRITAIKYTGDNEEEIRLLSGCIDRCEDGGLVLEDGSEWDLDVGDMVILYEDGEVIVKTNVGFHLEYTAINPNAIKPLVALYMTPSDTAEFKQVMSWLKEGE